MQTHDKQQKVKDVSQLFLTKVDTGWYDSIEANAENWTKVGEHDLLPYDGIAVEVKAGQVFRMLQPGETGNAIDFMLFNRNNPFERNNFSVTAQNGGLYLRKYSQAWSGQPYTRPMATLIEETLDPADIPEGYAYGFQGGHCTSENIEHGEGRINGNSCHTNFYKCLTVEHGIPEHLLENNLNAFAPFKVSFDEAANNVIGALDVRLKSKQGDFVDYFAEIDLLVAFSHCPVGPLGCTWTEAWEENLLVPMKIEVFDTGVEPKPFKGFHDWRKDWPKTQDLNWKERK